MLGGISFEILSFRNSPSPNRPWIYDKAHFCKSGDGDVEKKAKGGEKIPAAE
jgi:hypothetical protein